MTAALAEVTTSGLEDGVPRSRGEGAGEVVAERGPGAAYHMFVVMEDLVEKLKLLRFEEEFLRKSNLKALPRHYFALPTNPGEQFYMFYTLAAWLINKAGRPFEQPQEYDDPNATISNILSELRSFMGFCHGDQVGLKLLVSGNPPTLASENAVITRVSHHTQPVYPVEELEEESIAEDDAELTLNKVDEEFVEEETDDEENFIDLNVLKAQTYHLDMNETAKQEDILESTTDAAEWSLEVERVLPQLKVTIRTDNKDWRIHVDQMHQHKSGIESALKETKGFLDKHHNEITRTLEKIGSREKYINNQLENLVQEYRAAQAQLSEVMEDLEKVKQEIEEKSSSMTDG
ncbi:Intraflagellar transport protein 57-like protein, partial [Plecturocebus cupreus]